ncbi:MAG: hypothetical protein H0T53_10925, partial [Herpetosiphonaceae bacterium]|nr:hypothetical protein [Herpetosiphonaceae bacterium]
MTHPNQADTAAEMQDCPKCAASIPTFKYYPTWCDQCSWNLKPHTPDDAGGRFARLYTRIGAKFSRSLFEKTVRSASLQPRWTASKLLA